MFHIKTWTIPFWILRVERVKGRLKYKPNKCYYNVYRNIETKYMYSTNMYR